MYKIQQFGGPMRQHVVIWNGILQK